MAVEEALAWDSGDRSLRGSTGASVAAEPDPQQNHTEKRETGGFGNLAIVSPLVV